MGRASGLSQGRLPRADWPRYVGGTGDGRKKQPIAVADCFTQLSECVVQLSSPAQSVHG